MSVKVREQRGKLYLDIYHNGTRKWESLHITLSDDKRRNKELYKLAEICRTKREAQVLSGEWDIKINETERIALSEYIKNYARVTNTKSMTVLARQIEKYNNGSTIRIGQVTSKWIEDFQAHLLNQTKKDGKPLSQSSVGAYMKLLRAVFRKAVNEGTISHDPTISVSLAKVVDPEMVFLTADELKNLASVMPESDFGKEVWRAFLFACFTGLRISDIETLTWGMIEFNPSQIIKRQKKTKNTVYIPLNKTAEELVFDGLDHAPDERVFMLGGDVGIKRSYKTLKSWATDAGIKKKIGWHTARRTFATLTLGYGADAVTVARLLGHTGLSQVMKYAKSTDKMKRQAVDALPKLV